MGSLYSLLMLAPFCIIRTFSSSSMATSKQEAAVTRETSWSYSIGDVKKGMRETREQNVAMAEISLWAVTEGWKRKGILSSSRSAIMLYGPTSHLRKLLCLGIGWLTHGMTDMLLQRLDHLPVYTLPHLLCLHPPPLHACRLFPLGVKRLLFGSSHNPIPSLRIALTSLWRASQIFFL